MELRRVQAKGPLLAAALRPGSDWEPKARASCLAASDSQVGRPWVVGSLGDNPAAGSPADNLEAWAYRAASDTLADTPSAAGRDSPLAEGSLADNLEAWAFQAASDIRADNPSAESQLPQAAWGNRWADLV